MSFPRQVAAAFGCISIVSSYPLYTYGTIEIFHAAIVGAVLATVNVLLGYAAIEHSFNKSATVFLKVVIGGMGIRMFGLAGILVLLIKVAMLNVVALVGSMGIFYVVFLMLEVLYINKKVNLRQQ
ncbi:MAG: hypothetical protein EPO24_12870 [Bacteroidetes bacterium]|nr:MAG: hypothetical protein EPO24_12870 [Bacteroidota bacterium]